MQRLRERVATAESPDPQRTATLFLQHLGFVRDDDAPDGDLWVARGFLVNLLRADEVIEREPLVESA
jgi:hypothetical protein